MRSLKIVQFLFLFTFFITCKAQHVVYTIENKKAIKLYENATKYYDARDNENAIKELNKAIEKEPKFVEAYTLLASVYIDKRQLDRAIEQYNKSFQVNPNFFPNSYYTVANLELMTGKYEDSKKHFQKFLAFPRINPQLREETNKGIKNCEFAIDAMKHPVPFNPINLGGNINSDVDEYFPSLTADGQTIIFTRNEKSEGKRLQEDFYTSKMKNGNWSAAQNMIGVNTPANEGAPSISADGQIIFFAACQEIDETYGGGKKGYGSCDIFYTNKVGEKWTRILNLGTPVNSRNWETQPSFSSDGKTLYFVRGMVSREGIKQQDIYTSQVDENGLWSIPVRLSDKVNSSGAEESVFIHPDNQTLYFSSDGRVGMGGMDIYMSRRQADGEWGEAINLGYPINTWNDENSVVVGPDGKLAYMASNREGGFGQLDLYGFELYDNARPQKVTYVKGKVYDAVTSDPLAASFELIDLETAKTVVQSTSNEGNGEFLVCLPPNKNYALNVSKKGYLFYSDNFSLKEPAAADKPYSLNVPLQPIDTGSTVVLKNIFFDTDKFELKSESKAELGKLISFLNMNKNVKVELSGHTDNVGDKKHNLALSQSRAQSVFDYLIQNGILAQRLTYKGYGDIKPKVANDTPENRSKNRRTELKIISK